jgi:hypothetical protein
MIDEYVAWCTLTRGMVDDTELRIRDVLFTLNRTRVRHRGLYDAIDTRGHWNRS